MKHKPKQTEARGNEFNPLLCNVVGIGNNSPPYNLDVRGKIIFPKYRNKLTLLILDIICYILRKMRFTYTISKVSKGGMLVRDNLKYTNNPADKLIIYSSGRVGIGS